MPNLIVDLSETYLKQKVESAFLDAATCKAIYDRTIKALGGVWYIDRVQVTSVGVRSGATFTKVMQPGLVATPNQEVLADVATVVTLANLDVLKADGSSRLPLPFKLTLRVDATAGGGDLVFSAEFHSVKPAKVGDLDVESLFKAAIPKFTEPMGLASLAATKVTVKGASMGRLANGTVRIGVGIANATKLGALAKLMLQAKWTTLWSSGGPTSPLKKGDDWALLITSGGIATMAHAQFPAVAAKLKANDINVSGSPSVSWDGASATLKVKAQGEYEVPVCPDINLWFEAKTSFAMANAPTLTTTVCTDGGLTGTGWVEAILCGLGALAVGGLIAGPLGELGTIVGSVFAGVYASEKLDENTGCTVTTSTLAAKGFSATRLASDASGLIVAGTASLAPVGASAITVSSDLTYGQWVNPRCAGNYAYAPVTLTNTSKVPVTVCRCESYPPFEVIIGGYTYQSGATIAETIPAGGSLSIKARGSGTLLIRTTGGIGTMKIEPNPGSKIPVTLVGVGKGGKLIFEASWGEPLNWACSNLKNIKKMGKLPLVKWPIPPIGPLDDRPIPFEHWLMQVPAKHRSLVVWDVLIENPPEGFRAGLISEAQDPAVELAIGETHEETIHLNVAVNPSLPVDLLLQPHERAEREGAGALRIWRAALTRVAELETPTQLSDVAAIGDDVIGVDRRGLMRLSRSDLGTVERPVTAGFERLLEISDLGEQATLCTEGTLGYLAADERFMVLDLSPGATAIIGDCGLDGARALSLRAGRAVVATEAGLATLDITDPHRPMVNQYVQAPTEGPVWFHGDGAYLADGERLIRFEIRDKLVETASVALDTPIEQLGGYTSRLFVTAGGFTRVIDLAYRSALPVVGTLSAPHWSMGLRHLGEHYWQAKDRIVLVHQFVPSTFDATALDLAAELSRGEGPTTESES